MPTNTDGAEKQWVNGAPGSDEALRKGCRCPVLDNAYGRGVMGAGRDWYISGDCPLHARAAESRS